MKSKARHAARLKRETLVDSTAGSALIDFFPYHLTQESIAGFAPIGDEIDLWPLLEHLNDKGRQICLPVTPPAKGPLSFRNWQPGCVMQTDRYGVKFPAQGATVTPSFVLVPLLAFTATGKRLGYGGGYYDRTLAYLRAQANAQKNRIWACGVAYAGQEIDDLPTDIYDQTLDGILTETGFRTFT